MGSEGVTTSPQVPVVSGLIVISISGSATSKIPRGLLNAAWKRSLSVGAQGEDVTNLQLFLICHGFLSEGNAIGFFGPRTKTALMQFQKANGLAAVGIFGPMTRAKVSEMNVGQ